MIPFALFPWGLDKFFSCLPFGSIAHAPLTIYTGMAASPFRTIGLQLIWNVILWITAAMVFKKSKERMISFGGQFKNTSMISRIIGRGQLDHVMIQPVPLWAELLAQGFSPLSGSSMLVCGIGLTAYAVRRLPLSATLPWLLLLLIYAVSSTILVLSVMVLLSCAAFYAPAAAEEIAQTGRDLFTSLKTYPLGTMNHSVKRLFLTLLPVGLAAWFPSELLLKAGNGGLSAVLLLQACYLPAAALALSLFTIYVFKKGMKYYAVNGSPRYSGFGHR